MNEEIIKLKKLLRDANRGAEINAKINQSLVSKVIALEKTIEDLRNGYEGSCYCCEIVAKKNKELLELIERLENSK